MPSTLNKKQVIELTEKLKKAKAIYFTDYLGLDVSSITKLRKEFFDQEVEFLVAKNTLIKLGMIDPFEVLVIFFHPFPSGCTFS